MSRRARAGEEKEIRTLLISSNNNCKEKLLQRKTSDVIQLQARTCCNGSSQFGSDKADNGAAFGCKGFGIFLDPSTAAQEGTEEEDLYPNTFWMDGTAVQRGSLALSDGDPQTPNWPSVDHAYRLDEEDRMAYLPSIPVQPFGYTDAEVILRNMSGMNLFVFKR